MKLTEMVETETWDVCTHFRRKGEYIASKNSYFSRFTRTCIQKIFLHVIILVGVRKKIFLEQRVREKRVGLTKKKSGICFIYFCRLAIDWYSKFNVTLYSRIEYITKTFDIFLRQSLLDFLIWSLFLCHLQLVQLKKKTMIFLYPNILV